MTTKQLNGLQDKDGEFITNKAESLFPDLQAPDMHDGNQQTFAEQTGVIETDSLCFNCYKSGMMRLLLVKIPFFKEVIISSFICEHCGFENRDFQSASTIEDRGVKYTLTVKNKEDLNRHLVLSSGCVLGLPDLDASFRLSEGSMTTTEGAITQVLENITSTQGERRTEQPEVADGLDKFVANVQELLTLSKPFTVTLEDISGKSQIQSLKAPLKDPQLHVHYFMRNENQDAELGLGQQDGDIKGEQENAEENEKEEDVAATDSSFNPLTEVVSFIVDCPECHASCDSRMKYVQIPHFKEVIIMSTVCNVCGHRDNEVKGGGAIEPKGKKITLKLTDPSDLARDVLKSDSCGVEIPELELEACCGTLGGKFTTVEGLLKDMRNQLSSINPFMYGDSAPTDLGSSSDDAKSGTMSSIVDALDSILSGKRLFVHLVLDDPAGNSYLQNTYAPDDDPEMTIEAYERNYEQNEFLGLNDMKTENYH